MKYQTAIRKAFNFLLASDEKVCVLGQGLWSPWYVGDTMRDLDKTFGRDRVIDTPVSENCVTGMGVGLAIAGYNPIVVHPRMDFMMYAMDPIVNQAAKWRHTTNGRSAAPVTVRGIINRGGEQGAQHSQALHALFAHIPGLRVVMPSTPQDAYSLLIGSVRSKDPVIYIDDRWLYECDGPVDLNLTDINLANISPDLVQLGDKITIVASGFCSELLSCVVKDFGGDVDLFDLRQVAPLKLDNVFVSVQKTGRLLVVDSGGPVCGLSAEVIAAVSENLDSRVWKCPPRRLTPVNVPAPCAGSLEQEFYLSKTTIRQCMLAMLESDNASSFF